jgi:DNA-binding LacI/PurR family transcriptional regulator
MSTSVRQLAKASGVSPATVSRVLNNQPGTSAVARDRVLAALSERGFNLAANRKQASTLVGLAYTSEDVGAQLGGFDATLIAGIMRGLREHKFDLAIIDLLRDKTADETYSQLLVRKGIRGLILRVRPESRAIAVSIAAEGFPLIVVGEHYDEPEVNFIRCQSGPDSRRAIEYLINLGHRRIALGIHHVMNEDHRDRLQGYRDALEAAGIGFDPNLVIPLISDVAGGAAAINQLVSLPEPPTAIYFTNPLSTLGGLRRAHEMGIAIPRELSIIGFDDSRVRDMAYPRFTAVCQDAEKLGMEAALWLTRRLVGVGPTTCRQTLGTIFEVNHTTMQPRQEVQFSPPLG